MQRTHDSLAFNMRTAFGVHTRTQCSTSTSALPESMPHCAADARSTCIQHAHSVWCTHTHTVQHLHPHCLSPRHIMQRTHDPLAFNTRTAFGVHTRTQCSTSIRTACYFQRVIFPLSESTDCTKCTENRHLKWLHDTAEFSARLKNSSSCSAAKVMCYFITLAFICFLCCFFILLFLWQ